MLLSLGGGGQESVGLEGEVSTRQALALVKYACS